MTYVSHYSCKLGPITLASDGTCLTGLWFDDQQHFGSTLEGEIVEQTLPIFDQTRRWLDTYFAGQVPDFTPMMCVGGSDFRQLVARILISIPYGQTVSYGQIAQLVARQTGRPHFSAQAVGGAVAHNPISIIIPCHRVVGAKGQVTGYAGGLFRKIYLLSLEQRTLSQKHC